MDNKRAYMITQIELALIAARRADEDMVALLLEGAMVEALKDEHVSLADVMKRISQDNEPG